ncbi:MAG: helix-turn-helix domain-containing protein [Cyanobacteria bacterium J06592_8]
MQQKLRQSGSIFAQYLLKIISLDLWREHRTTPVLRIDKLDNDQIHVFKIWSAMLMSTPSEHQPQPTPRIFSRTFDEAEAASQAILGLKRTSSQLTPGKLHAKCNFADFNSLKFVDVICNQGWKTVGEKSSNSLEFVIEISNTDSPLISHGYELKILDLFAFDYTREVDLIAPKNSHIVIASVDLNLFQSLAEEMGYDCFGLKFIQQNIVRFDPVSLEMLKAYYREISILLNTQPSLLMQPQMQSLIVDDFYPLLISTLGKKVRKKQQKPKIYRRYPLVKKAEEITRSDPDKPLTLKQLCSELGTSSSALSYGFQDLFGMSPMAYIKTQRLNGVRRTLKKADPKTTMVIGVAQQWGFWSNGHLARDYKQMFGELPSETLKQSSKSKEI